MCDKNTVQGVSNEDFLPSTKRARDSSATVASNDSVQFEIHLDAGTECFRLNDDVFSSYRFYEHTIVKKYTLVDPIDIILNGFELFDDKHRNTNITIFDATNVSFMTHMGCADSLIVILPAGTALRKPKNLYDTDIINIPFDMEFCFCITKYPLYPIKVAVGTQVLINGTRVTLDNTQTWHLKCGYGLVKK